MSTEDKYAFLTRDSYAVFKLLPAMKDAAWGDIEASGDHVLAQLEERNFLPLIVDLTEIDYMGSSVVALLVRIWKSLSTRSSNMVVLNRHELVYEVLELAGLTKVWTVVDSLEVALDELGVSDAAVVVKRETRMLSFVGPLMCLAGIVGGIVYWNNTESIPEYFGAIVLFGCSGLALVTASISAFREVGWTRGLSLAVVFVSLGLIGGGFKLYLDRSSGTDPDSGSEIFESNVTSNASEPTDVDDDSPGDGPAEGATDSSSQPDGGPALPETDAGARPSETDRQPEPTDDDTVESRRNQLKSAETAGGTEREKPQTSQSSTGDPEVAAPAIRNETSDPAGGDEATGEHPSSSPNSSGPPPPPLPEGA